MKTTSIQKYFVYNLDFTETEFFLENRFGFDGEEVAEDSLSIPQSSLPISPIVRKDFPETWIWDTLDDLRFVVWRVVCNYAVVCL